MIRSLFALVGVGAAIALFLLYTKPTFDSVKVLQDENESYDLALEKAAELQRLKQSLLSRFNAFNPADIERLHKLLPDHVDNVRLVLDLDTLASKHAIALQNVAISRVDATETAASVGAVIGPSAQHFDSLTLRFATSGSYERFLVFLTDLENSLRIVDLVNLTIEADTTATGSEPIYRYDITLRTYWLK